MDIGSQEKRDMTTASKKCLPDNSIDSLPQVDATHIT